MTLANRSKVVDLAKERRNRTGTVWDGERMKLATHDKKREAEIKAREQRASRNKLLAIVALIIAAIMLGSLLLNFFL